MIECPWSFLPATPADFCEASLCAWIRQPANTWSNVGFLVCAVVVYLVTRDPRRAHLRGIAYISLATAIGSAFFHASETALGALEDYIGMYLGSAYMLCVCFRRWRAAPPSAARIFFWTVFAGLLVAYLFNPEQARHLYMIGGIVCAVSETSLAIRDRKILVWRWFIASWIAFSAAYTAWYLDVERILCNPDNHVFGGHAFWHLANALAFYFTFLYYGQFDVLRYDQIGGEQPSSS